MAIGDTENDIAIIKSAHIGVAMGNATEQLKADSDYITDTNDNDGVAKAIYHFQISLYRSYKKLFSAK